MAAWKVTRMRGKLTVIYVNLRTGQMHNVGDQRFDTPVAMITDWIALHGHPGDWITVDGQPVMVIQDSAQA